MDTTASLATGGRTGNGSQRGRDDGDRDGSTPDCKVKAASKGIRSSGSVMTVDEATDMICVATCGKVSGGAIGKIEANAAVGKPSAGRQAHTNACNQNKRTSTFTVFSTYTSDPVVE